MLSEQSLDENVKYGNGALLTTEFGMRKISWTTKNTFIRIRFDDGLRSVLPVTATAPHFPVSS